MRTTLSTQTPQPAEDTTTHFGTIPCLRIEGSILAPNPSNREMGHALSEFPSCSFSCWVGVKEHPMQRLCREKVTSSPLLAVQGLGHGDPPSRTARGRTLLSVAALTQLSCVRNARGRAPPWAARAATSSSHGSPGGAPSGPSSSRVDPSRGTGSSTRSGPACVCMATAGLQRRLRTFHVHCSHCTHLISRQLTSCAQTPTPKLLRACTLAKTVCTFKMPPHSSLSIYATQWQETPILSLQWPHS